MPLKPLGNEGPPVIVDVQESYSAVEGKLNEMFADRPFERKNITKYTIENHVNYGEIIVYVVQVGTRAVVV